MAVLLGLLFGTGNFPLGVLILFALLLVLAILAGPQLIAMLWLVGSPTVFGILNQGLSAIPLVTMERLLFCVLAGIVAFRVIFKRSREYSLMPLEVFIIAFLLYALMSLLATTTSLTVRQDLWFYLQYAVPMLMFLLSRRIEWSEKGLQTLLAGLTVTGVLLALIGILQGLLGISLFTPEDQQVTSGHIGRAHGTFSNSHTYIASLFIFMNVTILQFGIYRDALLRFVLLLAMGVIAVAILLGQTRAPWGGAAIALCIICLIDKDVRPMLVVSGAAVAIAGSVVMFLMIDQLDNFFDRVTNLSTMAGRLAVWATAINMLVHNPLFGMGFGANSFLFNKAEYISGVGPLTQQYAVYLAVPHNEYLHIAVLLGLPGIILFLLILVSLVRYMFAISRDSGNSSGRRRLALYVGATFIGLLFNSLFSDTYLQDYFWMLTYFLAGLVAGMPRNLWRFGSCVTRRGK
jgi:O-antigen ligase